MITNNSCVLPDKGIAKLPSESFGSSVYATFICLLDTSGTVSNTFCPVLNGWFGRWICLFDIETNDEVRPTSTRIDVAPPLVPTPTEVGGLK